MKLEEINKLYKEGQERALADDAGVETPSPFSNPYDPWFPSKAAEWERGYNETKRNLDKTRNPHRIRIK